MRNTPGPGNSGNRHSSLVNRQFKVLLLAAVLLGSGIPSLAHQRPLKTDDPDIVPTGRVRLEFGVEFLQGQRFSLSGLEGTFVERRDSNSILLERSLSHVPFGCSI